MQDGDRVIKRLPPFDWYKAVKREERAKLIEGIWIMAGLILLFSAIVTNAIGPALVSAP